MAIFIKLLLERFKNNGLAPPAQKAQPGPGNGDEFLLAPPGVELLNPGERATVLAASHSSESLDRNVQVRTLAQLTGVIDQSVRYSSPAVGGSS